MKRFALALAPLLLNGCAAATPPVAATISPARAAIGQIVRVDGPRVTPLAVLEDSRCPEDASCVWAGRVKIKVRIDLGARSEEREMERGKPIPIADGTLELVEVLPERNTGRAILPEHYQFGFRFMGGL